MCGITGKSSDIRLFVIIADADSSGAIEEIFQRREIHEQRQYHANGTARNRIASLFGLGGSEKMVTACVVSGICAERLLKVVAYDLSLELPGNGIAFTIPVSGITERAKALLGEHFQKDLEHHSDEENKQVMDISHHLIVVAINQGYSEELVEEAKNAGATGGTVWSSRRVGHDNPLKHFGFSVQGEQEIIAILATKETKLSIMTAIKAKYGVGTDACGIILSLPVDGIVGFDKGSVV